MDYSRNSEDANVSIGQSCQPLRNFNQPMFRLPAGYRESRPCLCRRCRRSRRRSTDRRAIESERRWLLICTAKRGSIETIPRHCSLRNATRRKRKNFFFLFFYSGENYSSLRREIFEIIRPNTNEFRFSVFAGILGGEINRGEWRARSIHDIR